MREADVIAAIATGGSPGAIGVIRLSGPELSGFMTPLLGRPIAPRRATLSDFLDSSGQALDTGIAVFFPGPHSYTGEDVLELQGHGGPAVLQLLLRRCLALGARLAQPGEFSRRAFLNQKLDLAQAEGVADLIAASSEAAVRAALRSLKGEFSEEVRDLVRHLTALRVELEANIDFPEEDAGALSEAAARSALHALQAQLERIRARAASGKLLRDGLRVALIGAPNVGKSSLLNRLAGDDVAIVTALPGTTRDTVRSEVLIAGVAIHLADTAGLRETHDPIEQLGIERTWRAVEDSDLVLVVADATDPGSSNAQWILDGLSDKTNRIMVLNKIDRLDRGARREANKGAITVEVSAKTGAGMDLLKAAMADATGGLVQSEGVFLARERHLEALGRAAVHLEAAQGCPDQAELFAEELRLAQIALGQITGEFTAEDLLGEIFSKFCIGK